jgi:hypothetical protein
LLPQLPALPVLAPVQALVLRKSSWDDVWRWPRRQLTLCLGLALGPGLGLRLEPRVRHLSK